MSAQDDSGADGVNTGAQMRLVSSGGKPSEAANPADPLLLLNEVEQLVRLKKSAIYRGMVSGEFPACVRLSGRRVAWRRQSVLDWIENRPAATFRAAA